MAHNRRILMASAVLFALAVNAGEDSATAPATLARIDAALARGVDALLARQAPDGGWHSENYALLKPGVASTALVVDLLSRLPDAERAKHAQALARGLAFLKNNTDAHGAVGSGGDWVEYPSYATALTVQALLRVKPGGWTDRVKKSVAWLCDTQNAERTGCAPKNPAYGGWNPTGAQPRGVPFHADLSTTRYVVEALSAAKSVAELELAGPIEKALDAAALYAQRCQNFDAAQPDAGDGGFIFTATQTELNKAGDGGGKTGFRSYGSSTADGVLLLNALLKSAGPETPVTVAHAQARDAAQSWLAKHAEFEHVPGFKDPAERRATGMVFYYRAATAAALSGTPRAHAALRELGAATLAAQKETGLYANSNDSMKEDEPLLATPLALDALLKIRNALKE